MKEPEYQWPSSKYTAKSYKAAPSKGAYLKLKHRLEKYFSSLWQCEAVILPSARSAMSLILNFEGMGRKDHIFAPEWSSHCVWNSITPYSNPTLTIDKKTAAVIAVHKFGYIVKPGKNYTGLIIEDSCDSLVVDANALFPNGGKYEIFSLPKIMGTYGGGIILTKDTGAAQSLRKINSAHEEFNSFAGKIRWLRAMNKKCPISWEDIEYQNFSPSFSLLFHVENNLAALQRNQFTILQRSNIIMNSNYSGMKDSRHLLASALNTGRLPALCIAPPNVVPERMKKSFMTRNLNLTGTLAKPNFKPYSFYPYSTA